MTRSSPGQVSFSSGEVSPLLAARMDYQRFQTGLSRCRGFLPLPHGPVTRAPGTWFRGTPKDGRLARLVDFQFAEDDAVVLEFTHLAMRVWRYGQLVMSGGSPFELVTPYGESSLSRLQWVQSADVMYLADGLRPIQRLARLALNNWTIGDAPFERGPFLPFNFDKTKTVYATAATGAIGLIGSGNPFTSDMVGSLILLEPVDNTVPLWTGNQAATVGNRVRYGGNIYELVAGNNTGVNPPVHLEGDHKYDAVANTTWRFKSGPAGIARITAFTNANSVNATVIDAMPETVLGTGTYRWALSAWSDSAQR